MDIGLEILLIVFVALIVGAASYTTSHDNMIGSIKSHCMVSGKFTPDERCLRALEIKE